ncbi:MAG TPA: tetratricopeptide repeat protein [Bryobacteraceae bacterium]|nr:tetratricopeptide repeat protein [Bryobacteraceae bacterium]
MLSVRLFSGFAVATAFFTFTRPVAADTYHVIISGKVTMEDGAPPPFTVGIERVCTDIQGSAPGPITNKKGEYTWNMELDTFNSRTCWIQVTHPGYVSTRQDISAINATSHDPTYTVPTLIISRNVPDPHSISVPTNNIPDRAKSSFDAAMKSLDAPNFEQAASQLSAAVKASPKFAEGWHALGVVDERLQKTADAREAYEQALKANPKFLQPYVTLAALCIKTKDWECAAKVSADGIKADTKHLYSELYIHQAVVEYQHKDLSGAESSVQQAIQLDPYHHHPREEYVLGRILEAKGDTGAAKEHIEKYLQLMPNPPDIRALQEHLSNLGKPEAAALELTLEP